MDQRQEVYQLADPAAAIRPGGANQQPQPDDFYQTSHNAKIRAMVKEVVATEGPVAMKVVVERVARAYGLMRAGNKINQRISSLAGNDFPKTSENGQVYLWPRGSNPAAWTGFRINPAGQKPLRPAETICPRELKNLADYVQEVDCPLDEQGLLKGVAERLGFKKLTQKLETVLRRSIL